MVWVAIQNSSYDRNVPPEVVVMLLFTKISGSHLHHITQNDYVTVIVRKQLNSVECSLNTVQTIVCLRWKVAVINHVFQLS